MPPQRTSDRTRPRQDPVSCQLCRSKKLKCDRNRPCSNCNSRGLQCEYQGEPSNPSSVEHAHGDDDLRAENKAIRLRLQALEQAVFGGKFSATLPISSNSSPQTSTSSVTKEVQEKTQRESQLLEALGNAELDDLPDYSDAFQLHLHDVNQMLSFANERAERRHMSLPNRDLAMTLLEFHARNLDSVQHIMHLPTVRQMFFDIYAQLESGQTVHPGSLALMLSVCSNAALYWTEDAFRGTAFTDEGISNQLAQIWIRHALICIEQVRIGTTLTLETVQGSILVGFMLYHTEGFSARARLLHAGTHAMARDMGMHRIDVPGARPKPRSQDEIVRREMERKVWWHLTCTDWILAFVGGPHEGIYSLHPRHMRVELPRNLNHEDLTNEGPDFTRSLKEPTVMSYYLQRIKLGTVCREVIDTLWEGPVFEPDLVIYDNVMMLDAKFDALMDGLPSFLRLDKSLKQLQAECRGFDLPSILIQRIMINLMICSRRCKLHLPFLIRCKSDQRFSYSRSKCVKAAQSVFALRDAFREAQDLLFAAHYRNGGVAQHFFYAAMVLIMDLCINNPDDVERKAEVREALDVMEESTALSRIARQFLESLVGLLRKYQVKIPGVPSTTQSDGSHPAQTVSDLPIHTNISTIVPPGDATLASFDTNNMSMDSTMQFDNIWEDFVQHGTIMDNQDWDALMNDLEARVM